MTFAGLLPEKADAELKKWLQAKAEGQDPKMALALMRDLFDLDTVMAFKEAKVPVRCINSAGGYQLFTPTAVETNKKYADFGAVIIEGAGHYPMPNQLFSELLVARCRCLKSQSLSISRRHGHFGSFSTDPARLARRFMSASP